MSFRAGMCLNSIVAATFPGGLLAWAKAGCDLAFVPSHIGNDKLYVLLPEDATSGLDLRLFRQRVTEFCQRERVDVRWVAHANFEDVDPLDAKQALEERLAALPRDAPLSGVNSRPAVLLLKAEPTCRQAEAEALARHFAGVEGLRRVAVQCADGVVEHGSGLAVETKAPVARKQPVAPRERGPISTDDIIRVHELLTTAANVDEFVRSISMPEPSAR